MVQDEKSDLERQLKHVTVKSNKTDELKIKFQKLQDQNKSLKSKYALLTEKVKQHTESGNCPRATELSNILNKISQLGKPKSSQLTPKQREGQERTLKFMKNNYLDELKTELEDESDVQSDFSKDHAKKGESPQFRDQRLLSFGAQQRATPKAI